MAGDDNKIQKIKTIDAGKAVAWTEPHGKELREGEKPSAPANLVLPKPVKVPAAATSGKDSDKK